MPLTMKLDQTPDMGGHYRYVIRSGGLVVGLIDEVVDGPSVGSWRYSLAVSGYSDAVGNGFADTLTEARDRLRTAWQGWLKWARLQEDDDEGIQR
jgi:hypothetical protein